ncbi:hypothetical protein Patl1_14911 [Pistacia atlantica]|uniref:Uncharacterized protein n=1 Tax=Pistacia atlantica TaxID=434234 RepID=A0ACC1ATA1_9ROSI|nr:hypothetical protein Patl1_14911 [Pistacia atlantica]
MSSNSDAKPPPGESHSDSLFSEFTAKMTEALTKVQTPTLTTEPSVASIGIKLNETNYALWSQVVEMYISSKDKLGYINGDIPQPSSIDPTFRKWRTDNAIVKGWLINSMDPSLIGNFIRFPTAKLAGGSLEKYYNDLQGLWCEIDLRRPNPMECAIDIQHYNLILQEDRVYVFLDGLDDRLDKIRGDVLQLRPFLTVEQAYAHVHYEALCQSVMITDSADGVSSAVLATKGLRLGLKCSHCGNSKHTRDTCFKLHEYPDWWNDLQAKKGRDLGTKDEDSGQAVVVTAEPQLSFTPQMALVPDSGNYGCACYTSTNDANRGAWLLDFGATDHMTFATTDFITTSLPKRTNIANANGITSLVTSTGTVAFSPTLQLHNTLLVPSLSHKLLSVSQLTSYLNCIVLMYPTFCLLQDILAKEITGRGTKRGGLYYMEDYPKTQLLRMILR